MKPLRCYAAAVRFFEQVSGQPPADQGIVLSRTFQCPPRILAVARSSGTRRAYQTIVAVQHTVMSQPARVADDADEVPVEGARWRSRSKSAVGGPLDEARLVGCAAYR